MKAQKNKIVFVLLIVFTVLFISVYSILTFGKDKEEELDSEHIPLPDLEDTSVDYESKLEAIEAIKEEKQSTAPSIYPDHMMDDKGYFNPDYMEYEKQRIIDSVYQSNFVMAISPPMEKKDRLSEQVLRDPVLPDSINLEVSDSISTQKMELEHQLFFASHPTLDVEFDGLAHVDGNQIVKNGHRLILRLDTAMYFNGHHFPIGSRIYGFIKIRPNRILLDIVKVGKYHVKFKAFDLQDGQEGIYVENQLRGEVVESGLDAALGEINIPGIPQVGGVKRIFQRRNRSVKVAIQHQYQIKLVRVP
ncbi:MAG: conjugative transposon protein TraM [Muricauda sp. TMED12]|nr:MAG: conjugative transposon protein TraM [Muricauda sp. TMED12]